MRRTYCWKNKWIRKAWSRESTSMYANKKYYRSQQARKNRTLEREILYHIRQGEEVEFSRTRNNILYDLW